MPETKGPIDITILISVNEDGDWVVGSEDDDTLEMLKDQAGGTCCRTFEVTLRGVPLPRILQIETQVPAELGTVEAMPEVSTT